MSCNQLLVLAAIHKLKKIKSITKSYKKTKSAIFHFLVSLKKKFELNLNQMCRAACSKYIGNFTRITTYLYHDTAGGGLPIT